jgi:hypothetical protein
MHEVLTTASTLLTIVAAVESSAFPATGLHYHMVNLYYRQASFRHDATRIGTHNS